MKEIYLVYHGHDGKNHPHLLGYYSTMELAKEAAKCIENSRKRQCAVFTMIVTSKLIETFPDLVDAMEWYI